MLQSGEVDIDFDRIFTHSYDPRIRVTCNGGEGQSLPAKPPAGPATRRRQAGRQPARQAGKEASSQAGKKAARNRKAGGRG